MKYFASFAIVQLILIFAASNVHAESSVNVNVNTNTGMNCINGRCTETSGNSNTYINVDGTEIKSTDQGEIKVRSVNGQTTVETSPGMKVDVTKGQARVLSVATTSATATNSPVVITEKSQKNSAQTSLAVRRTIIENIRIFIDKILREFGFGPS